MIDILYLSHGRNAFTDVSLKALVEHTSWSLVNRFVIYDDVSEDQCCIDQIGPRTSGLDRYVIFHSLGSPVNVMKDYMTKYQSDFFAKIDNDLVVCPNWLENCLHTIERQDVDFLGINPQEGHEPVHGIAPREVIPAPHIGGIGVYRTSVFQGRKFEAEGKRHGLDTFQEAYPEVRRGWISPPLPVFLLDYLPFEPWKSLSTSYEKQGLQRPRYWPYYSHDRESLWNWMYPEWSKCL